MQFTPIKKNMALVFAGNLSRSFCLVAQGFIIARYLGAQTYGLFSIAMSFISLVFGIVDFKIAESVVKFLPEVKEKSGRDSLYVVSTAFIAVEIFKGVAAFLIVLGSGWLATSLFYRNPGLFSIIIVLSLNNLFVMINPTATAFLRLGGHFKLIAGYDVLFGFISLGVISATAILTRSLDRLVWAFAIVGFLGGIAKNITCLFAFRKVFRFSEFRRALPRWRKLGIEWKRILVFSLDVNFTATIRYIAKNLDVLILAKLVPLEAVGAYSLARKIGGFLAFFTDPLPVVIYPEMTKNWAAGKKGKVFSIYQRVTSISFAVILGLYVLLALSAGWFVPKYFGKSYALTPVLLWFLFPLVTVSAGFFLIYHLLLTIGKSRTILWGSLIHLAGISLLVPLLSWLWHARGAAMAVSMATVLSYAYCISVVRKEKVRLLF